MAHELENKDEKLYTAKEVKAKKTVSGLGGLFLGALGTIVTGVILNKAAHLNITDATTKLADEGLDKLKGLPKKFSKEKEAEVTILPDEDTVI
jgi:hypothetical protein